MPVDPAFAASLAQQDAWDRDHWKRVLMSPTTLLVAGWGASIVVSAVHGYKRHNGSVGAAVGWGVLGGIAPVVTPVVALAEGYGEPLPTANRPRAQRRPRRRRSRR